jgi:hypothetical protein
MEEDSGVLGNLPRTRPGTRSQKRDAPTRATRPRPAPPPRPPAQPSDPVGEAVRGAANLAGAGLKLANGVTREVLRRLPRP